MKIDLTAAESEVTLPDGTRVHWRRNDDKPERRTRIHVDTSNLGVLDVMEDLANRMRRPHQVWRPMVAAALTQLGYPNARFYWSQYAGCTCPCSPGFIMRPVNEWSRLTTGGTLWISLVNAPRVDESKLPRQI